MYEQRVLSLVLVLGMGLACSKPAPPPPPETSPAGRRSQPVDFNAPLNTSLPDQARVKLDLAAARAAVAAKRQVEGKLPDSLDELGLKLNYPGDLSYDSSSGAVKSSSYPTF